MEGAADVLVAPEPTIQGSRRHRVAAVEQHLRVLKSHPLDVPGRGRAKLGAEQSAEVPGVGLGRLREFWHCVRPSRIGGDRVDDAAEQVAVRPGVRSGTENWDWPPGRCRNTTRDRATSRASAAPWSYSMLSSLIPRSILSSSHAGSA
jgi:hypothetical protein